MKAVPISKVVSRSSDDEFRRRILIPDLPHVRASLFNRDPIHMIPEETKGTPDPTNSGSEETRVCDPKIRNCLDRMHESYTERINTVLKPVENGAPLVVDLFAGCGGLALGFEAQGFATHGFEMDENACATYNKNLHGTCTRTVLSVETHLPKGDILIGGPPCQPFSVNGHQLGLRDSRDGFPTFVAAVRQLQPKIWIFENVRGLFYRNHWYLEEIIAAMQDLNYLVEVRLVNAVSYGIPQNRERVFAIGHRGRIQFPAHCEKHVTAGEALGDLAQSCPVSAKILTPSMDGYIARYEKASKCIRPRDLHLDRPARTLTCRNLAGATADMMRIRLADGRRRRLTLQEAKRLQSFPDWFEVVGGETSAFNQIGNAVPPLLAYQLAGAVRIYLESPEQVPRSEVNERRIPIQTLLPIHSDVVPYVPCVGDLGE